MIPLTLATMPASFDTKVRQPGLRAIAEMVGKTSPYPRTAGSPRTKITDREEDIPSDSLPPYWTRILDDLMDSYREICAYSCFRIHPVTGARSVDHVAAKTRAWHSVYEWHNYRLASSLLNARKGNFDDVLDPVEIQEGWFELELVGFQVKPASGLPEAIRASSQDTIDRLGLNDFCREREERAEDYWAVDISFRVLLREAPFVAKELRRQGRLRERDR